MIMTMPVMTTTTTMLMETLHPAKVAKAAKAKTLHPAKVARETVKTKVRLRPREQSS